MSRSGAPPLMLVADAGTTGTKAGVVDDRGRIRSLAEAPNRLLQPEPGAAEHDPGELFRTLGTVCRRASRGHRREIGAVVLSGYQLGLLALDRSVRPLTAVQTLLDVRPQATFPELKRRIRPAELYRRTGCPPSAQYPLARLHWLRRRRPTVFRRARWFAGAKDYLVYRLCGRLVTETGLSSATQLLDIRTGTWDPKSLALAGIRADRMPPLVASDRVAGRLTRAAARLLGLDAGLPVVPGAYDAASMLLGVGGVSKGIAAVNFGTTAMFRMFSPRPVYDTTGLMRLQTYRFGPRRFLTGAGINNAGNVRDWLVNLLGTGSPGRLDARSTDLPPGAEGLRVYPYFTGERDARIGSLAAGAMTGLRSGHGAGHLGLAVLEGVAFTVRLVLEAVREHGVRVREVRVGGGGAGSKLWVRVLADTLGVPVRVPPVAQPSLVGGAMLGFLATGVMPTLEAAAVRMVRGGAAHRPSPARAACYERIFRDRLRELARLYGRGRS